MSITVFDNYTKYYDLLYKDKDYESEAKYIYKTLNNFKPGINSVLELGMGTGIHATILKRYGIKVTGVELSQSMAQIASQKGLECYVSNCVDFKIDRKFDAAISLFHVISYLTSNDDLISALKNVYSHLNEGGYFIFDVWYTPAVHHLKPEVRVKRLKSENFTLTRIAEPIINCNENTVDVNYNIYCEAGDDFSKITECHVMRHFGLPELMLFADITGFKLMHAEEWLSGNMPSENTWGVTCILKKSL